MQEIDWSVISSVMSHITAIVAIAVPAVTSILTIRSQERMKKLELYSTRVYDALEDMALKYAALLRGSTARDEASEQEEYLEAMKRYSEFSAASYRVMSLIPNEDIASQISELLGLVSSSGYSAPILADAHFNRLMMSISKYVRTRKFRV